MRFLIHKVCENYKSQGLSTFSIGLGIERRTVVCYGCQILSIATGSAMGVDSAQKQASSFKELTAGGVRGGNSSHGGSKGTPSGDNIYRHPHARLQNNSLQSKDRSRDLPVKPRRPDRAVYVPRAKRLMTSNDTAVSTSSSKQEILQSAPYLQESSRSDECTDQASMHNSSHQNCVHAQTPKKIVRKNFCNVYTPPHARSLNASLRSRLSCDDRNNIDSASSNIQSVNSPSVPYDEDINLVPNVNDLVPNSIVLNNEISSVLSNPNHAINEQKNSQIVNKTYSIKTPEENSSIREENSSIRELWNEPICRTTNCSEDIAKEHNSLVADYSICNTVDSPFNTNFLIEDVLQNQKKDVDSDENELKRASEVINRSNRRIIKQSFVSDVLVISDPVPNVSENISIEKPTLSISTDSSDDNNVSRECSTKKNIINLSREDNDWDTLFDDDGECLDPTLLAQLTETVGKVHIQKPRGSYEQYQTRGQIMVSGPQDEMFSHVLEVYNFPQEFKTHDLLSVFSTFKDTGFEIKWVDDTHALAVFSSSKIAAEVLAYNHPMVRTRPIHEATAESRQKARKSAEFLQPYRPRPETCTALARRLVTGALGVKLSTAKQERLEERRIIREAREKKKQAALQREAAWEGTLENQTEANS